MKVNELLEEVLTPKEKADKIYSELQAIFNDADVIPTRLSVLPISAISPNGTTPSTSIFSIVIPKIKNGEYDADEANFSLRLAHRLISRWLAQKEADGQSITVGYASNVGGGRTFSTRSERIWTGSKRIKVPSFYVAVSIDSKEDTSAATKK
jgi:hypothetical protein